MAFDSKNDAESDDYDDAEKNFVPDDFSARP